MTSGDHDANQRTVAAIVRRNADQRGSETAIVFGSRGITWQSLRERAARVACGLRSERVSAQDRVAYFDKNGPEFFEWQFGASMANAVTVGINWRLAPDELIYTLDQAQVKVLLVGAEFFDRVGEIELRLGTVTKIIALSQHPRWEAYEDWLARQVATDPRVPSGRDDVAIQVYTSGTTGLPKGVMLTNANLFVLFEKVAPCWGMRPGDVNLVCLPVYHLGGPGWGMAGMHHGCTTVMVREFDASKMLDVLSEHGVQIGMFVPAMLSFMCQVPGAGARRYPIRRIVYGGSPISNEVLLAAMTTFGCEFTQVYGMTETTGSIASLAPDDHCPSGPLAHRLRSAGKPFPWVECRIVEPETGAECTSGQVGELWTRSSQNMKGYWNNPEATASTITPEGWLRTGDAGYFDEDGYLFLIDRVKDMIVSGGENIYPAEVENALASHPDIAEMAVIGVPSERWGETVKAIVVLKPGRSTTGQELIDHARQRLAHYKCPTSVDFIATLPRNPSGKVLKRELRDPYWPGRTRNVS